MIYRNKLCWFSTILLLLMVSLANADTPLDSGTANTSEVHILIRKAVEQGQVDAQFRLGVLYYDGVSVTQDYVEASKWFRKAAEQGQAETQFILGNLYSDGVGAVQNYAEAFKWHSKAAEQGHTKAQLRLGLIYYKGEGVDRNSIMSYMFTILAAAQGEKSSFVLRDLVLEELSNEQIVEAQRIASEWRVNTSLPCPKDFKTWP